MKLLKMLNVLKNLVRRPVKTAVFDKNYSSKKVSKVKEISKSRKQAANAVYKTASGGEQIVIKENKNNALIKCWKCGKETWVKKGSVCFNEGLCSKHI